MTSVGDIGVIFVNFHSEALISPRAQALRAAGMTVVVADNSGSYDGDGIVLRMPGNQGFAAACNAGAAAMPASVSALCFHNPDASIDCRDIVRLSDVLRQQQTPGAVAPAERAGNKVRERGYRYPSAVRELLIGFRGPLRTPAGGDAVRAKRRATARGRRFGGGGLMVVCRHAHEAIGGFDERFFLYGEDLDYWDRLVRSGFDAAFDSQVEVDHPPGTGSPMARPERELLRWIGIELFAELAGRPSWQAMRLVHRRLIHRLRGADVTLVSLVAEHWRRGSPPSLVAQHVRDVLVQRSIEAASR